MHTFTIAGWSGKSSLKRLIFVLAYVIVDGYKTAIANELREVDLWDSTTDSVEYDFEGNLKFISPK